MTYLKINLALLALAVLISWYYLLRIVVLL